MVSVSGTRVVATVIVVLGVIFSVYSRAQDEPADQNFSAAADLRWTERLATSTCSGLAMESGAPVNPPH